MLIHILSGLGIGFLVAITGDFLEWSLSTTMIVAVLVSLASTALL